MTNVRMTAKTFVSIVMIIFLLHMLWSVVSGTIPIITGVAFVIWGTLLLLVTLVVYAVAAVLISIFHCLFSINSEGATPTARMLLYMCVLCICGFVAYRWFPITLLWVEDFISDNVGLALNLALATMSRRLFPFELLGEAGRFGSFVWVLYLGIGAMLSVQLLDAILEGDNTPLLVLKRVRAPLHLLLLLLALSFINIPQLSLHRLWAGYYVLTIIFLWRILYCCKTKIADMRAEGEGRKYSMVDMLMFRIAFVMVVFIAVVVVIALVAMVYRDFDILRNGIDITKKASPACLLC